MDDLCKDCIYWQGYQGDGSLYEYGECEQLLGDSFDWEIDSGYCDDYPDLIGYSTPCSFSCLLFEKGGKDV